MSLVQQPVSSINIKKYPKYKGSGVSWLGEIPEHWEIMKLGSILKPISSKNHPKETLLSITREKGVIVRNLENEDENHNYIPDDLTSYKLLKKGQFGMNKMKAWQGSYGVSGKRGIVSPAYYIFEFTKNISPRFFHLAIRSKLYVSFFGSASDGVRIGQWDLSKDRMKKIPIAIPPLQEQTAIAKFLDDKTQKIDEAIAIKKQQIALFQERQQILIQNAVTGKIIWSEKEQKMIPLAQSGVDSKDSGVSWFGEIPEHWELLPGFTVYKENKTRNAGMKEDTVLSLSYGKIIIKPKEKLVGLVPESFETYQIVKPSDIIIRCMDLQNDKTSLRTGIAVNDGIITSAYLNLNIINDNISEYVYNFLHTLDTTKVLYKFGTGLRQNLSFADFKHLIIPLPPKEEQKEIVDFIEDKNQKTATAISYKQQEIEKLQEYKSSLINSCVTGKIKVR